MEKETLIRSLRAGAHKLPEGKAEFFIKQLETGSSSVSQVFTAANIMATDYKAQVIKDLKVNGEASYKGHDFIFDFDDVEIQKNGEYVTTLGNQAELEEFLEELEDLK